MTVVLTGMFGEQKGILEKINAPLVAQLEKLSLENSTGKTAEMRAELDTVKKDHEALKLKHGELVCDFNAARAKLESLEVKLSMEQERATKAEEDAKRRIAEMNEEAEAYVWEQYVSGVNTAKWLLFKKYPNLINFDGIDFSKSAYPPGFPSEDVGPNVVWEFDEEDEVMQPPNADEAPAVVDGGEKEKEGAGES